MSYELAFVPQALKEWKKLDPHTRQLFKTRLIERLEAPRVQSAQLRWHPDR
jgi:mRNA interferase RelE/StbE